MVLRTLPEKGADYKPHERSEEVRGLSEIVEEGGVTRAEPPAPGFSEEIAKPFEARPAARDPYSAG
jgi:hypothetical protein